jgi:phosphoglycolate phosphatase
MKLVLFDIDQTILHSGGAGEGALRLALRDCFGCDDDLANIEIAGKTDVWIAHRIFEAHGIPPNPENLDRLFNAYLHHLEHELARTDGRLLPGFPEILHALAHLPHIAIGLLTGNLRRGAQLKLGHYGVWQHFPFGAFADDSHDRNLLGPFARDRARQAHGADFSPRDIYVIGDTPHDIACAKAFGAIAVGVATGRFSRAALESAGADHVFDDLSNVQAVIHTLNLGSPADS